MISPSVQARLFELLLSRAPEQRAQGVELLRVLIDGPTRILRGRNLHSLGMAGLNMAGWDLRQAFYVLGLFCAAPFPFWDFSV